MRSAIVIALGAFAALVSAARENPFNVPRGGYQFTANQPTTLTWQPTTDGTVTIKLQKGDEITPDSGIVIAPSIPNSGSFAFVPSASLGPGSDYTIQIIDDTDPDNANFTPRFAITGTTGTATELTGSPTATVTRTPSSSASTESESTTESTTITSADPTTTTESSSPTTTSDPTTSESEPTETEAPTETPEPIPDSAAASLSLPAGLLSALLGLMALL